MENGISVELFEKDGMLMAKAPDGSEYLYADIMRHNNPGFDFDDYTGAPLPVVPGANFPEGQAPRENRFGDVAERYGNEELAAARGLLSGETNLYDALPESMRGGMMEPVNRTIMDAADIGAGLLSGAYGLGQKGAAYLAEMLASGTESEKRLARDMIGGAEVAGIGPEARMLGAISEAGGRAAAMSGVVDRLNQPGPVPTMYSGPSGFADYLKRVNPRGIRVAAEDRPNLMMGDMYGMLPSGAKRVGKQDDVTFYRGPDGDFYATAFNPDVGEQDVVGYIMPRGDMTELAVVSEMQGKGLGGELQYLFRKENPDAPTGGLTEAGEKALRKTYERLSSEGLLGDTLPTPRNDAEAMAKQILEMRAAGRAGDVTEEMMAAADPQYMFYNTPLPMDEASRMARKEAMYGKDRYHGGNMDFQGFSGNVFTSDNPTVASTYNRGMLDAQIYPVVTREGPMGTVNVEGGLSNWNQLRPDMIDDPAIARELDMGMPISTRDIERQAAFEGRSGVTFKDINDLGPGFNSQKFKGLGYTPEQEEALRLQYLKELSVPSEVDVRLSPNLVRSRFARFDPEFAHLRNLSAGVGGLGLLSLMYPDQELQ